MLSVGIVGLPNAGKSTLFKALTRKQVDIAEYSFCTKSPNVGVVEVPDERLKKIAEVVKPQKITPAVIEFVDIAGLIRNAHKGEGLGNQFLSFIREVDIIVHLVRAFENKDVIHPENSLDPLRDVEIINTELALKDLETTEKVLEKLKKEAKSGNKESAEKVVTLTKVKVFLEKKSSKDRLKLEPEEEIFFKKELPLLSLKPVIYVLNINEGQSTSKRLSLEPLVKLNAKLEAEIAEFEPEEAKEYRQGLALAGLDGLIKNCYNALNLISFYTITGGKEARAWPFKKGAKVPEAGGVVHSDFEEKFIRAEVINWHVLIRVGSWAQAREKGALKTEGKDYIVQDGDVIEFKI